VVRGIRLHFLHLRCGREAAHTQTMSNPKSVNCNRSAMKRHLRMLATIDRESGERKVTVQIFPGKKNSQERPQILHVEADDETINELAMKSEAGATVAVVPQCTDFAGRKRGNMKQIRYLVADLDHETSMDDLLDLAITPDLIVETSPGRFHVYFRAKCQVDVYVKRARALAKVMNADMNATDVARVLRVAGTINWKHDDPFVAKLHRCERNVEPRRASSIINALRGYDEGPAEGVPRQTRRATGGTKLSQEQVQKLLDRISARDRPVWLHVGMALHSWDAGRGFALWDEWSKTVPEKYSADAQQRTWDGFATGKGRSVATLYYYARLAETGTSAPEGGTWLPVTDAEIAEYAARVLSDRLKIVGEKDFYVFREHRWHRDTKAATRLLLEIVKDLQDSAKLGGSDYARRQLKNYTGFQAAQRLLTNLHAFEALDAKAEDFDKHEEFLGVPNGVIELRTGKFRAGRPDDMLTIATAAHYDPEARCPRFKKFLADIAPSKEYRVYLQTLLGYLLIGHGREQKSFIMLGSGSNGKGTLTRLIEAVMGDVYCTALSPTFLKNASKGTANGPTPALMPLRNARVIFCTESEQKRGIDEVFFKQLSGNDKLTGRHNYGDQQSFSTAGKLVLSTNVMPDWSYGDEALWRRVEVLPFVKQFTAGTGRNNNLDAELAAETSGVLNWMIVGARRYLRTGQLAKCDEVVMATRDARAQADTVRMWIEADCARVATAKIGAQVAYDAYLEFVSRSGLHPVSIKQFSNQLPALGFTRRRVGTGIVYSGLSRIDR
jgi:P4 family phage/plasmid primase-like protien